MNTARLKLAILAGIIIGAFLAFAGAASAHTPTPAPAVTDACYHNGETTTKHGETFKCVVPKGASCGTWVWQYNPGTPKSSKTAWPKPSCPCKSASPTASPSHTPTVTPTPSHTATPSGSATAVDSPTPTRSTAASKSAIGAPVTGGGQLPVTGSPVVGIVSFGTAFTIGGLLLVTAGCAYRRRTTT